MTGRHRGPLLGCLLTTLCAGCAELQEGVLVEEEWLIAASEVTPNLAIPCAEQQAKPGSFQIRIDDRSGYTVVIETGTNRVWLREPFGLIPDTCWWLPDGPVGEISYPEADCFENDAQYGNCTGSEELSDEWMFHTPGIATTRGPTSHVVTLDGLALLPGINQVERLDLTPEAHEPVDDSESSRTFLDWLTPLTVPSGMSTSTQIALNTNALMWWDSDQGVLYAVNRKNARHGLGTAQEYPAPKGEGKLTAAGNYAAIITPTGAHIYDGWDTEVRKRRRGHQRLNEELRSAAIDPNTGEIYALVENGVLTLPERGPNRWYSTPNAMELLQGWPGNTPTVYAWGNDEGHGLVYRLEADTTATLHRLEASILGMGTGEIFQEIVIATAADEQVQLVSYLDQNHRTSLTGNPLTLAIAAFVESPRDHFLNQEDKAASLALTLDGACDDLSAEALVCCVHHNRALHLEAQLSWFDQHLSGVTTSPAAVLLGVNPSAIAQSIACEAAGYPEWAQTLPQVTAHWANEWESTGVGSLALLLHTPPFVESAGYVQCTESWNPTEDCWKIEPNTDSINAHFTRLSEIARLSSWTDSSPYWSMLGGGYEGFGGTDLPSWTDLFPTIALPDSHPPKGLYFGLAGMNPLMNEVAAKDLAPTDTTKRAFPTELGPSPMEWDRDDGQGRGLYYPGQTFALPWLYESRRSGLLFVDFNTLSHPFIDWSSDQYPGQEGPTRIDYADAALELHYLITRNLAHRESSAGRWTYIHLHDLSSLSNPYFDAWATKGDPAKEETALHYLKENIDAWNDVITWKPTP